jgi:hypothetical protein
VWFKHATAAASNTLLLQATSAVHIQVRATPRLTSTPVLSFNCFPQQELALVWTSVATGASPVHVFTA